MAKWECETDEGWVAFESAAAKQLEAVLGLKQEFLLLSDGRFSGCCVTLNLDGKGGLAAASLLHFDTNVQRTVRRVAQGGAGAGVDAGAGAGAAAGAGSKGSGASEKKVDTAAAARAELKKCLVLIESGKVPAGEDCAVCMESFASSDGKDPAPAYKLSKCVHMFHEDCVLPWLESNKTCPVCKVRYGVQTGNMPSGTMTVKRLKSSLPGNDKFGTIQMTWNIPSGTQSADHPKPGVAFAGTNRHGYLPDSPEGNEVLKMIQRCFDRKLFLTVGKSLTTGQDNVVIWNGIHIKTAQSGGPEGFGYPDDDYLKRVTEELTSKGCDS